MKPPRLDQHPSSSCKPVTVPQIPKTLCHENLLHTVLKYSRITGQYSFCQIYLASKAHRPGNPCSVGKELLIEANKDVLQEDAERNGVRMHYFLKVCIMKLKQCAGKWWENYDRDRMP